MRSFLRRSVEPAPFDGAYRGATEDVQELVQAARLLGQYALTVKQMNSIRLASLPPSALSVDEREVAAEDEGVQLLTWLYPALTEAEELYKELEVKGWAALTPLERRKVEAATFLRSWATCAGLQRWSSEELAADALKQERSKFAEELLQEIREAKSASVEPLSSTFLEDLLTAHLITSTS
jgi:hypothetical protein